MLHNSSVLVTVLGSPPSAEAQLNQFESDFLPDFTLWLGAMVSVSLIWLLLRSFTS